MKRPSMAKAVQAKCAECCGFFVDGRHDCQIPLCPLYYWMRYKRSEPILWWIKSKLTDMGAKYRKAETLKSA